MNYKDLIQFEPITSVVKLVDSEQTDKAKELVKSYVFSTKIKEDLKAVILRNLKPDADYETKGIQIVGSYGTGKSHLMSLVSAIADNADLLSLLPDTSLQQAFNAIAGRYKVLRFEVGTDRPLKDIMFAQLERFLQKNGVTYTFDEASNFSWKEYISAMMAEFEAVYPDKHLLVVFFRSNPFLLMLTLLGGYVGYSGYRAVRLRERQTSSWDMLITVIVLVAGGLYLRLIHVGGGNWSPAVIYPTLSALVLVAGYDLMKHFWLYKRLRTWWLYEHIYKMLSAYSAILSAFSGTVLPQYKPYSQILPSALCASAILYFIGKRIRSSRLVAAESAAH